MHPFPLRFVLVACLATGGVARADEPATPAAVESTQTAPEAPAAAAGPAPATSAPEGGTPPVGVVENPTPPAPPAPVVPDPWQQFADAAELGVAKNAREADAVLDALERANPGHPAALRAAKLRTLLVPTLQAATPSVPARAIDPANPATWLRPEGVEPLARAELAILQTLHGVALGLEFCGVLNNCSAQATAVALIAGGGAGLGLSLFLSGNGLTAGHALAMNAGTLWGAWHGLALNFILQPSVSAVTFGLPMGAQLLGLGAGHVLWTMLQPAVGDVSLANSGGLWSGVLSAMLMGASGAAIPNQQFFATILVASDVGLILGAIASSYLPMSRGRTLIIDAGALLGILLGAAMGVLGSVSGQAGFALMSAGLVIGAGGGFWLTRAWDKPPPAFTPQLSVVPTPGGAMAMMGWQL